jgi:transposase InsO family protein
MNIAVLCEIGKVSRSGYYKWLKDSTKPDKDASDSKLIKEIFEKGKRKLGWRSIRMKLFNEKQIVMNHKKISRIMKKYLLFAKIRRRNPYKDIAKKTQEHQVCENKLNREFKQIVPLKVFCTDITYLFFNHHLAYLSVIKDICSGEIVGWKLSTHIDMALVLGTIKKMQDNSSLPIKSFEDIMIHSDQGFHYTNPLYIKLVQNLNMVQSMSRKGNCIDNAPMESFFGHFKDDVDYGDCKTFDELSLLVEEYIEYYNNARYQWDLKKMTPVQYRNHLLEII